jgi:hypothetical protein
MQRRNLHGEVINCRPRKIRKKFNRRFVKKRIEKNKIDIIVKRYKNEDNTQTVVVRKGSILSSIIELMRESIYIVTKIIFWITVCALITIGINTLLNHQLREQLINMFQSVIGG